MVGSPLQLEHKLTQDDHSKYFWTLEIPRFPHLLNVSIAISPTSPTDLKWQWLTEVDVFLQMKKRVTFYYSTSGWVIKLK